jgi:hypothetical protein
MLERTESRLGDGVSLTLDDETRTHLDRIRASVAVEFEQNTQQEVDCRFEAIVTQLLSEARFPDFIPVLAWRYAREYLKTMAGLPAEFRPNS